MRGVNMLDYRSLPSLENLDKSAIINTILNEEYGYLPAKPNSVTAEILHKGEYFAGKAIFERVNLKCEADFGEFSFPLTVIIPKRENPVPAFVHISFMDGITNDYQPAEEIIDNGFAVLSFAYNYVTKDNDDFTDGVAGVVYKNGERKDNDCGKLGLWAWAASCVLDYALQKNEIDSEKITVIGHSRLGKTAILAGAIDDRFYCAVSNDSGCGGASLSRENKGETIRKITDNFPYWFCENFKKYRDNEDALPFDQHFVIAANAPHRVYVASAKDDEWAYPENEYLGTLLASEYYAENGLLTAEYPEKMPSVGDVIHKGYVAYHLRAGSHFLSRTDWNLYMKYLKESFEE